VRVGERGAGQDARAADPVAAGRRTEQDDEVAGPRRGGAREIALLQEADGHDVDERIALIGRVEDQLAADRRDADAVAIPADSLDDALDEVAGARVARIAEPKGIEDRDRPGAHREDVAEDPADTGRGALRRLDRARVVVRFDLEGDRQAAPD